MFSNIGGKIKGLVKLICWIGIIASVIIGCAFFADEDTIALGIIYMLVGAVISWIGSFLLYGFGELIDNVMQIRDMLSRTNGVVHRIDMPSTWKCAHCGQENSNVSAQCKGCGQYKH